MKKITNILLASVITGIIGTSHAYKPREPVTKPIIAQYFGIWTETKRGQTWEQKFRKDTPFEKLTRIYIAFCKPVKNDEGHYTIAFDGDIDHAKAIMDRVRSVNPNAEIFVSVVGNGSSTEFGGAAKDTEFAANVQKFLAAYRLNGVDIDWEEGLDKNNLNALVSSLAATLHANGYKLTLAGWSFPSYAYDMEVLRNNLDQINIMSYGKGTTLESCAQEYVKEGFPANQLIGGVETEVPFYQSGGTDSLGPEGTLSQKAHYALDHGLAGMMEWRLDNDYPDEDNLNYPTYKGAVELWDIMTS